MKRIDFIKSLGGVFALINLPLESVKQFEKIYIKQCFVRGFQYYSGPSFIQEMNENGSVELVREPENEFDSRAIAFHFNGMKIGYLPRESNKTLSILMDTDLLQFHAEITHIEPDASHWEQIRVAVYALKEIKDDSDWKKIENYNALKTPRYYSLQTEDNRLTRIDIA